MRYKLYIFCFLTASFFSSAQFYNLPNDYFFSLLTERELAQKDAQIHSDVKPYVQFFNRKYVHYADSYRVFKYITEDPALDITFFKHVLSIEPKTENFKIHVDPILGLQNGRDLTDTVRPYGFNNTRGVIASINVGKDLYAESMFVENQSLFPGYVATYVTATGIVPGQGRYKPFNIYGADYAFSSGFISYSPWKNFNFQIGHGKHKIGNGYRSLLLSDNAFNYPYARITQQWFGGKLQYTNIYAVLMNLVPATAKPIPNAERLFQKKPAAFQHLSVNVTKAINVSLFQGIIFRANNNVNKPLVNVMYANPLIFSHAGYYGLNDSNNLILGADLKIKITKEINVYGQVMADNLSDTTAIGNSYGYQLGLNYFNALGVKNLFLQAEYNFVNENSYKDPGALSDQSYSHYNQNLAYTPAWGNELVLIADHKYQRFGVNFRYNLQNKPLNNTNFTQINIVNTNISYLINPAYNLNVYIGYNYRFQKFYNFNPGLTSSFIYLGLKTSLFNAYYDF
ncbi:MAG: hypothetical protein IPG08_06315 [Sphingobacteriaceae bacterium]|nr:hypothetical protein [Sphingobacteriaceae bacterium]